MGKFFFTVSSITFILALNTAIFYFPGVVEQATGLDTSSLQQSTNVSADIDTNTSETSTLDQVSSLAAVYSQPETTNRILGGIFLIFIIGGIVLLAVIIIPG